MRALLAIALSAVGIIAGSAAASAADLRYVRATRYDVVGQHAVPEVIYQYEPGVAMRAYWLPPWHHHHYFPRTGKRPAIGRYEKLSARHRALRVAATFQRYWSNAAEFPCDCAWLRARDEQPLPEARDNRIPSAPEMPKP